MMHHYQRFCPTAVEKIMHAISISRALVLRIIGKISGRSQVISIILLFGLDLPLFVRLEVAINRLQINYEHCL